MVQWIQPILQNLGFQVSNDPNTTYEDSQHTIDIIKANHLTRRIKHIYVPISYVRDQYFLLNIDPVKLKTIIFPEDIGTKDPQAHFSSATNLISAVPTNNPFLRSDH